MKKIAYKEMFENEMIHGWYLGTREMMINTIIKYLPKKAKILDAGCGTGGTIKYLHKVGYKNITGIDISPEAIAFCKRRGLTKIKIGSVNNLRFNDRVFDAILCLDVLYHSGVNPKKATNEFCRVLKKGGLLYLQEPSYEWLKSNHDKAIQTRSRFTRRQLESYLQFSGFKVLKCSYFNTIFFLPMMLKRLLEKVIPQNNTSDVQPLPALANTLLAKTLHVEHKLLDNFNLPFGLSIVCVAQKTS